MNLKLCFTLFLVLIGIPAFGQEAVSPPQKETRQVILKVLSDYKNPMSYYPLRRDIFLPTEEEITKDEMSKSYPDGSRSLGFVVFVPSNDSTYYREPFVDANGELMDLMKLSKPSYLSLKSNGQYFRKRQEAYIKRSPAYSRILLFNSTYGRGLED